MGTETRGCSGEANTVKRRDMGAICSCEQDVTYPPQPPPAYSHQPHSHMQSRPHPAPQPHEQASVQPLGACPQQYQPGSCVNNIFNSAGAQASISCGNTNTQGGAMLAPGSSIRQDRTEISYRNIGNHKTSKFWSDDSTHVKDSRGAQVYGLTQQSGDGHVDHNHDDSSKDKHVDITEFINDHRGRSQYNANKSHNTDDNSQNNRRGM